jgi:hypothetical protein
MKEEQRGAKCRKTRWKTLNMQNNSLIVDLSEKEDLDNH